MSTREDQRKLGSSKREVIQLQRRLNDIDNEKESWFEKSQENKKEVSKLRDIIKKSKENRDNLTQEVRDSKEKRRNLNNQTRKEISHIKTLNKEKIIFLRKHHIRKEPARIKQDMERLEYKIETEALSFKKEQEVMKIINNLKKQLNESKSVIVIQVQAKKLSESIDNMKKEADDVHKQIQDKAKKSQENHEIMIKSLKQFDVFKKKEKEAYKRFNEKKAEFSKVNEQLKAKLEELNKISGKVEAIKEHFRDERKKSVERTLEGKRKEAEEKMRRGEKLTTEDILAMQGMDNE